VSRLKQASQTMAGRFEGWQPQEPEPGSLDATEPAGGIH
jgi:hypothetical protein